MTRHAWQCDIPTPHLSGRTPDPIGRWLVLYDFRPLPKPGVDSQYDALAMARPEAEDRDEVLRIELAIAISLLSQDYDLTPADYTRIFDFGSDRDVLIRMHSARSDSIAPGSINRAAKKTASARVDRVSESGWMGKLKSLFSAGVVRVTALHSW